MTVSAQIAIYPLRQERLTPAVRAVSDALAAHGLAASVGPMTTLVTGSSTPSSMRSGRGSGPRRRRATWS